MSNRQVFLGNNNNYNNNNRSSETSPLLLPGGATASNSQLMGVDSDSMLAPTSQDMFSSAPYESDTNNNNNNNRNNNNNNLLYTNNTNNSTARIYSGLEGTGGYDIASVTSSRNRNNSNNNPSNLAVLPQFSYSGSSISGSRIGRHSSLAAVAQRTELDHLGHPNVYIYVFLSCFPVFCGYGALVSLQERIRNHMKIDGSSPYAQTYDFAVSTLFYVILGVRFFHNIIFSFLRPRSRVLVGYVALALALLLLVVVLFLADEYIDFANPQHLWFIFLCFCLGGVGISCFECNFVSCITPLGPTSKKWAISAMPCGYNGLSIAAFGFFAFEPQNESFVWITLLAVAALNLFGMLIFVACVPDVPLLDFDGVEVDGHHAETNNHDRDVETRSNGSGSASTGSSFSSKRVGGGSNNRPNNNNNDEAVINNQSNVNRQPNPNKNPEYRYYEIEEYTNNDENNNANAQTADDEETTSASCCCISSCCENSATCSSLQRFLSTFSSNHWRNWVIPLLPNFFAFLIDMFCVILLSGAPQYVYDVPEVPLIPHHSTTISKNLFLAIYNACAFLGDLCSRWVGYRMKNLNRFRFSPLEVCLLTIAGGVMTMSTVACLAWPGMFLAMFANGFIYSSTMRRIDRDIDRKYHLTALSIWLLIGDAGSCIGSTLTHKLAQAVGTAG